jgi:hypothetical protein
MHKLPQNHLQWCQTNFSSIEDVENCAFGSSSKPLICRLAQCFALAYAASQSSWQQNAAKAASSSAADAADAASIAASLLC